MVSIWVSDSVRNTVCVLRVMDSKLLWSGLVQG